MMNHGMVFFVPPQRNISLRVNGLILRCFELGAVHFVLAWCSVLGLLYGLTSFPWTRICLWVLGLVALGFRFWVL